MSSRLLFTSYRPKTLEPKNSIGSKYLRLLDALDLSSAVKGKRTAIKMHLGGGVGFTTIHPFFVRKLVAKVKEAGAKEVFITDLPGDVRGAVDRGYTAEVCGCAILPASGGNDGFFRTAPIDPPFMTLSAVELAGEIAGAEALIDLAHVKGHGNCGFGGASKNLSMGCVTGRTRRELHSLMGGIEWDREKCNGCKTCAENCPNGAIKFNAQGELSVFYHDCKYCEHCVMICPEKALKLVGGGFKDFQHGMALATSQVLKTFAPENVVYINLLMNITLFCDCWGMTLPDLVPDIGILAGRDIVAIEQASLDLIKPENLIPGSLPSNFKLGDGGHLFEQLHRKDPYVVVDRLQNLGHGTREYTLEEVE